MNNNPEDYYINNVNRKDVQQSRNDWAKRTVSLIKF